MLREKEASSSSSSSSLFYGIPFDISSLASIQKSQEKIAKLEHRKVKSYQALAKAKEAVAKAQAGINAEDKKGGRLTSLFDPIVDAADENDNDGPTTHGAAAAIGRASSNDDDGDDMAVAAAFPDGSNDNDPVHKDKKVGR